MGSSHRALTAAIVVALACIPGAPDSAPRTQTHRPPAPGSAYLDAAREAARWIDRAAVRAASGVAWPADPRDGNTTGTSLYAGNAGIVLFEIAMARATGEPGYLTRARAGADWLLGQIDSEPGNGLYEGISGVGFALQELCKATRQEKYCEAARAVVERLQARAKRIGRGVEWSGTTDIISGNAGTILFLLYAARDMRIARARDLAAQAGERLMEVGISERGGTKWAMDPDYPQTMPNFSHGTAGVAYTLATLYQETGQRPFLDAALSGAKYLLSIAQKDDDSCVIFHHDPGGRDLYYLGWCHGPAGTGRLFYRLWELTHDRTWLEWAERAAHSLTTSGIPEHQTPGFWNNVSMCCGNAGVGEYVLGLYRATKKTDYLAFAKRVTGDLLARSTRDGSGMRWLQAEHRVRPELLIAQTGYMQGAAGVGTWLLNLDAVDRGRSPVLRLPDTPF